jgi:Zn-finger nucleic acid-binding protein
MNCPKCIGLLEEKEIVKGIKVDVCFVCEGIWFDKNELEAVIAADAKSYLLNDLSASDYDGTETKEFKDTLNQKIGDCPKCANVKMEKISHKAKPFDLTLDRCPRCGGIWLDGGEIEGLRDRGFANFKLRFFMLRDYWKFIPQLGKKK